MEDLDAADANPGYFSVTPLGCGGLRMSLVLGRYDMVGM